MFFVLLPPWFVSMQERKLSIKLDEYQSLVDNPRARQRGDPTVEVPGRNAEHGGPLQNLLGQGYSCSLSLMMTGKLSM